MNKRIIAVALALVIIVTCFAACKRGEKYIDANGIEHYLLIEDGSTKLDKNGNMVAYATEANGKIQKDEDGEPILVGVPFPEMVVDGNTLQTPDYKITLSKEWELQENGEFIRKENENIRLKFNKIGNMGEKSVDAYINDCLELYDFFLEDYKKEYPESTYQIGMGTITKRLIECRTIEFKQMKEAEGIVETYAYEIYFKFKDEIFQISYTCKNGSYDESFKIIDVIDANLALKD